MLHNENSLISSEKENEDTQSMPSTPTKKLLPLINIHPLSPPIVPGVEQLQSMLLKNILHTVMIFQCSMQDHL